MLTAILAGRFFVGGLLLAAFFCYSPHMMKKSELAKAIVAYCFRNTNIENIHAGITPTSNTGDFSDVFVVDANGKQIPWVEASRISQEEMKELMQTAVDRVYDVLSHEGDAEFEEQVLNHALIYTRKWDEPKAVNKG